MEKDIKEKYEKLCTILREMKKVAVAFSGGVDSTLLLKLAHEVLGENAFAVTACADTFPQREYEESGEFCKKENIEHITFRIDMLDNKDFCANASNRCYICKKYFFSVIKQRAEENGAYHVIEGSNASDTGDYRPGMAAIKELGVRSPLLEAGLTKADVRKLAKDLGLLVWDKPAYACLATRIPYGDEITKEKLQMIERGEQLLVEMSFKQMRVRLHGELARIEVLPEYFEAIMQENVREKIISEFKKYGFEYTALDLAGYRMGSMNEMLKNKL